MSEEAQTYKIFITEEEVEKDLTRVDVVELLYNDVATVTFTKVDGSERVMECTLLQEILKERLEIKEEERNAEFAKFDGRDRLGSVWDAGATENPLPTTAPYDIRDPDDKPTEIHKGNNSNVIVVYDIQVQDWRSFRLDSVKSIGFPNSIHTDSGTVYPTITTKPSVDLTPHGDTKFPQPGKEALP